MQTDLGVDGHVIQVRRSPTWLSLLLSARSPSPFATLRVAGGQCHLYVGPLDLAAQPRCGLAESVQDALLHLFGLVVHVQDGAPQAYSPTYSFNGIREITAAALQNVSDRALLPRSLVEHVRGIRGEAAPGATFALSPTLTASAIFSTGHGSLLSLPTHARLAGILAQKWCMEPTAKGVRAAYRYVAATLIHRYDKQRARTADAIPSSPPAAHVKAMVSADLFFALADSVEIVGEHFPGVCPEQKTVALGAGWEILASAIDDSIQLPLSFRELPLERLYSEAMRRHGHGTNSLKLQPGFSPAA